ncbi:MAG: hypothetical protein WCK01_04115 [Candidatus Uhrbacteria bacterium]
MKPLISIGDLMSFGFKATKETWKPTLKYSVWFFILPLAYYLVLAAMALGGAFSPSMGFSIAFLVVYFAGLIGMVIGLIWAAISIVQYMLAYAEETDMKTWKPKQSALSYVPGLLWLGIISSLPFIGAMVIVLLPALLVRESSIGFLVSALLGLISIPVMIWVGILFSQAQTFLLNDDVRGMAAIKQSIALVQNRWGAVFARSFIPIILFMMIVMAIQSVIMFIGIVLGISLFGGFAAFAGMTSDGLSLANSSNLGFGIVSILVLLGYSIIAFLIGIATQIAQIIYQAAISAKLFHSLKESK